MSQNLQKFANFQKIQLDNLVDFEKCCKTRICLQKSVPIQPKTSNILPKFAEIATLTDCDVRSPVLNYVHGQRIPVTAPGEVAERGRGPSAAACANFWRRVMGRFPRKCKLRGPCRYLVG